MAERTLIIIKPDGVQRHFAGEIVSRFERKGFKLVAAKFLKISESTARKHYAVHEGKPFFEGCCKIFIVFTVAGNGLGGGRNYRNVTKDDGSDFGL